MAAAVAEEEEELQPACCPFCSQPPRAVTMNHAQLGANRHTRELIFYSMWVQEASMTTRKTHDARPDRRPAPHANQGGCKFENGTPLWFGPIASLWAAPWS